MTAPVYGTATSDEAAHKARWSAWLGAPVLTAAGTVVTGRDLVAAGTISGRWPRLEAELALGETLRGLHPLDASELAPAVRAFRYARRLTSADDFRRWLAERDLTLGELRDAAARELLRSRHADCPAAQTPAAMLSLLPAEATFTGALVDIGWWLADRLLAAPDAPADDGRLDAALAAEAKTSALADVQEDEAARRDRLAWILAADAAFRAQLARVVSPEAIAACLDAHRLDWLTFDLEGLRSEQPHVAAEAALMLREDGLPLSDVARAAGLEAVECSLTLADAPEALATALTGVTAGEVLGPLAVGDAHEVWRVLERRPADRSDPAVRERAAKQLLDADAQRRRAGRVRWHERA